MAKGKNRKSSKKTPEKTEQESYREEKDKKESSQDEKSSKSHSKHKKETHSKKSTGKIKKRLTGIDFNKYYVYHFASVFVILGLILISMFAAVHYRMYTDELPMVDEMVEANVYNMLEQEAAAQVDQMYPNLPQQEREARIQEELARIEEEGIPGQGDIDDIVQRQADMLRQEFKNDEDGHTYLLGIDSYYFYRFTKNYLETGHRYGEEIDGKHYDKLRQGGLPDYEREPSDSALGGRGLHLLISAWTYQIASGFNSDITVMGGTYYVPLVIAALCVIPAFFIGRKIAGNFAGFFSAFLIALHPAFLSRTPGGFTHTEGHNVLFPLLAAWFIIEALTAGDFKKAAIWSALSALAIGLFSWAWPGWSFMLWVVFFTVLGYVIYLLVLNYFSGRLKEGLKEQRLKSSLISLGVYFFGSFLFVGIFRGFDHFISQLDRVLSFLDWRVPTVDEIWSNVMSTVAELNPLNASEAMANVSMGSAILMFFAFLGFALPMMYYKKNDFDAVDWSFLGVLIVWGVMTMAAAGNFESHFWFLVFMFLPIVAYAVIKAVMKEDVNPQYTILLLVWFAATFYATSTGVRFGILVVPAFSIAAGIAAGLIIRPISDWLGGILVTSDSEAGENTGIGRQLIVIPIMVIVFLLVFLLPFNASGYSCGEDTCNVFDVVHHQAKNQMPQMNDDWYETLNKIDREADEDAIISSWWDFGHWFAAIGQRPTTLDGGRQSSPEANWLGRLMVAEDEDESIGILRYLACGSNLGYERLHEQIKEKVDVPELAELETMMLLEEIIPLHDRTEARDVLEEEVGREGADEVLKYTHCENPPENYYITSEDMVGKSGVWAHFGSWDFEKAAIYNIVSNYDRPNASDLLEEHFEIDDGESKYDDVLLEDAEDWISPWPSYMDETGCTKEGDNTVVCENTVGAQQGINVIYRSELDLETGEVNMTNIVRDDRGQVHEEREGKPKKASFIKDDEFVLKEYDENLVEGPNERDMGVAIFPTSPGADSYRSVIMDHELTGSMFTRLFYFENIDGGMPYEEFNNVIDATGQKIITWKADWPELEN